MKDFLKGMLGIVAVYAILAVGYFATDSFFRYAWLEKLPEYPTINSTLPTVEMRHDGTLVFRGPGYALAQDQNGALRSMTIYEIMDIELDLLLRQHFGRVQSTNEILGG